MKYKLFFIYECEADERKLRRKCFKPLDFKTKGSIAIQEITEEKDLIISIANYLERIKSIIKEDLRKGKGWLIIHVVEE